MNEKASCQVLSNPCPLYWVKDREQLLIVDEQHQEIYALLGVEAAVWTWLTFGYPYAKIVELLAETLELPMVETEQRLHVIFQNWKKTGILAVEAV